MRSAVWKYIQSDLYRHSGSTSLAAMMTEYRRNLSFRYSFWLRCKRIRIPLLRAIAKFMARRLSEHCLIEIPAAVEIGYGFYISHPVGIVVSGSAKIGDNVNISQFTTIGSNRGRAARIGDRVYIGPGVSLVEDIAIGADATIGAGAIVVKDVAPHTTVAGNPATVISRKGSAPYIQNPWPPEGAQDGAAQPARSSAVFSGD